MSSVNTPPPSEPNRLPFPSFKEIQPLQKYRSIEMIMKTTKPLAIPPQSEPQTFSPFSRPKIPPKYKSMKEIYKTSKLAVVPRDDYSQVTCKICRSGDKEEEMLLCDGCDDGFHMMCLRPVVVGVPLKSWFCDGCKDLGPTHQESSMCGSPPTHGGMCDSIIFGDVTTSVLRNFHGMTRSALKFISPKVARRRSKRTGLQKKSTKVLLPYIASNDIERRKEQLQSLYDAMKEKDLEFSNELTYFPEVMAPRSANQSRFESDDIQVLSKENTHTVEKCKEMYKRGKCPPLRVVLDARQGYTVEADGPIKAMTFITEYTGDVDYIMNRENDDGDSFMTLLVGKDASNANSLLICPDKRCNIARFISGINNTIEEAKKKKNIKSVRYSVNGECRVFLIAIRNIAEGERLYYDYNGQENAYPTDHFD